MCLFFRCVVLVYLIIRATSLEITTIGIRTYRLFLFNQNNWVTRFGSVTHLINFKLWLQHKSITLASRSSSVSMRQNSSTSWPNSLALWGNRCFNAEYFSSKNMLSALTQVCKSSVAPQLLCCAQINKHFEEPLNHRCNREELPTVKTIETIGENQTQDLRRFGQLCLRPWGKEERFLYWFW